MILQPDVDILRGRHLLFLQKFDKGVAELALTIHDSVTMFVGKAYFISDGSQSHVGIILTEQDPIFGTGGKHAIGFVDTLCHEIIDQHSDISLISSQDDWGLSAT